jgi:Helix-turn-helix domain
MDQPTVRKTFKYKLQPTAEQEETMVFVLRRCRELYNAALEERRETWRMRRVSISRMYSGECQNAHHQVTCVRMIGRDVFYDTGRVVPTARSARCI